MGSDSVVPQSASVLDLASEAKRLTERLIAAESKLAALPWRVEARVKASDSAFLCFERRDKDWRLVWLERQLDLDESAGGPLGLMKAFSATIENRYRWNSTLVRDASIAVKAKSAELLHSLAIAIGVEYNKRRTHLIEGHSSLDAFEGISLERPPGEQQLKSGEAI